MLGLEAARVRRGDYEDEDICMYVYAPEFLNCIFKDVMIDDEDDDDDSRHWFPKFI